MDSNDREDLRTVLYYYVDEFIAELDDREISALRDGTFEDKRVDNAALWGFAAYVDSYLENAYRFASYRNPPVFEDTGEIPAWLSDLIDSDT